MRSVAPVAAMLCGLAALGCSIETGGLARRDDGGGPCTPMPELCDGVDNDCDPSTPDGVEDPSAGMACDGPDADECDEGELACVDGSMVCTDETPDSVETCGGSDEDCDGSTDEATAVDARAFYPDADGDTVGGADAQMACTAPSGFVTVTGDCDDSRSDVNPSATERCDGIDNNCDGTTDETGCSWPTERFGGSTYIFFGNPSSATWRDWLTATMVCAGFGYHLARIDTAEENAFLNEEARTIAVVPWWIGLNDQTAEGTFVWEDMSAPTYTNFTSMGGPTEDCVTLDAAVGGGGWTARACAEPHAIICEVP